MPDVESAAPGMSRDPGTPAEVVEALSRTFLGRLALRRVGAAAAARRPGTPARRRRRDDLLAVATLRRPWWLRPHPLFDRAYYLAAYPDIRGLRFGPWFHYARHGWREGRAPNRYLDGRWYVGMYPDVVERGMAPIDHYHRFGWREGRDPGPAFSTKAYLETHPDIAATGMDPLLHFLRTGGTGAITARRPVARPTNATEPARSDPGAEPSVLDPRRLLGRVPGSDQRAVAALLDRHVPDGLRVGIVGDGTPGFAEALAAPGRTIRRIGADGAAGDLPITELGAIAHLECLRARDIDVLFTAAAAPWLAAVPGLAGYLDRRYAVIADGRAGTLRDLRTPRRRGADGAPLELSNVVEEFRERFGRDPSIIAWTEDASVDDSDTTAGVLRTHEPMLWGLPHADASVDLVVVPDPDADALIQARRVASAGVVVRHPGRPGVTVEWLGASAAAGLPSASIVVPTYNDVTHLAACLRTLTETVPDWLEVEVIVSDDGSRDALRPDVAALVASVPRARLVQNPTNGGYIAAVMAGAAVARHDVLITLNNDTVLLPGWLEPLLKTVRDHPTAGVVGGRLVYPDGRLQEAGCAIFRDGSATKVGYGDDDPGRSFYTFLRPVDYVSGALLATPRRLFEELGGLDRVYGFGYYEDGDYCFRVRAAGRQVLYQPESTIVHVEGGTAGLDTTVGAKSFQARNQAVFVDRWRQVLATYPVRPAPMDIHASRLLTVQGRADEVAA